MFHLQLLAITGAAEFDSIEIGRLIRRRVLRAVVRLHSRGVWQAIWLDADALCAYVRGGVPVAPIDVDVDLQQTCESDEQD